MGALLQIDDPLSDKAFLSTYRANGNIVTLVNEQTGAIAAIYEYSPYGEPRRAQANDPVVADQPSRFSTKCMDDENGLVYYGHRYYSNWLGRFINRDPVEETGGLNLYAICGNDLI